MPFFLDDRHLALQQEARALAAIAEPFAVEADASSAVHPGLHAALAESGLWEVLVPRSHGGRFETVDPLAVTVVREVLMGTSAQLDSLFALQGVGSYAITAGGSDAQRAEWLPRVVSGECLAALALTEPEAGSDLRAITTALRPADDGGLLLSGAKAFISNAGAAGFYTVLARDGDGYTMVLVPADAPGLSVTPAPELISPHVLGDLVFDDVPLPTDARLGVPGRGFDLVLATLAMFRVSVAGAALGVGQAALEEATRHAAAREQFGRPMARLGAIASLLADSWAELEAARLLTYDAAERASADPLAALERCSMAKLVASETAGRIVDRCVQVMGRWGLIRDAKIERLFRQARPMRIYEGGSEVLRLGIARALVREVADAPAAPAAPAKAGAA